MYLPSVEFFLDGFDAAEGAFFAATFFVRCRKEIPDFSKKEINKESSSGRLICKMISVVGMTSIILLVKSTVKSEILSTFQASFVNLFSGNLPKFARPQQNLQKKPQTVGYQLSEAFE